MKYTYKVIYEHPRFGWEVWAHRLEKHEYPGHVKACRNAMDDENNNGTIRVVAYIEEQIICEYYKEEE